MKSGAPQRTIADAAIVIAVLILGLYVIEFVDFLLGGALDNLGVRPRSDEGLIGIALAPLLHAGWGHLVANTVPLAILGFILLLSGARTWAAATAVIWLVGGAGTWLVGGSASVHLGASVLVFGWLVFLILRGLFTRRPVELLVGAVVFVVYGSLLFGVLPTTPGVSWEAHLFGAIGGGLAAWWLARQGASDPDEVIAM